MYHISSVVNREKEGINCIFRLVAKKREIVEVLIKSRSMKRNAPELSERFAKFSTIDRS